MAIVVPRVLLNAGAAAYTRFEAGDYWRMLRGGGVAGSVFPNAYSDERPSLRDRGIIRSDSVERCDVVSRASLSRLHELNRSPRRYRSGF